MKQMFQTCRLKVILARVRPGSAAQAVCGGDRASCTAIEFIPRKTTTTLSWKTKTDLKSYHYESRN